jgi:CBS domain-containing protein
MRNAMLTEAAPGLTLRARTAAELMSPAPVSIRRDATVREATAMLTDRGYSAAPVIDAAGHPVGVVSRTDILVHDRESVEHVPPGPEFYTRRELATAAGEPLGRGFQVEKVDATLVEDIMTPAVFCVPPDTSPALVIKEMLGLKVHRLFVIDENGVLIGIISPLDILRHLAP